eukprot:365555-Chlamydomonas_euryale.AAC.22
MSRGMDVQNVRALATFCQFQDIRASPKLSNKQKIDYATRQPGSAVDPGAGLVNGAPCNDCDLAKLLRPEKPVKRVKSQE